MATLFEALGNVADIPGGAIRNLISGNNPLAPLLDPFGQSGRASGQEVLDAWGLGPDNSALGFGLELATDPLTYFGAGLVNRGLKGLNAASKATKGAGLLERLSGAYGRSKKVMKLATGTQKGAKAVLGAAKDKIATGFVPFAQSIPGAALDAAFNPDVRKVVGGAGLIKMLTEGRASDDEIVNGYLGNAR